MSAKGRIIPAGLEPREPEGRKASVSFSSMERRNVDLLGGLGVMAVSLFPRIGIRSPPHRPPPPARTGSRAPPPDNRRSWRTPETATHHRGSDTRIGRTSRAAFLRRAAHGRSDGAGRSEEHTSELQSRLHLLFPLLLRK